MAESGTYALLEAVSPGKRKVLAMAISETWFELVQKFAAEFGEPLPKSPMQIGDPKHGWYARYDRTKMGDGMYEPVYILFNGWPAGVMDANGGVLVGIDENQLLEWAKKRD